MVKEDVAGAQVLKNIGSFAAEGERARGEGCELEVGARHVRVEEHDAGEIHRAIAAKDLVFFELEVDAQALNDFSVRAGLDFEADGVAFAPVVELDADGLEQRAGFFFFEVKVGVASDAEGGEGEDFIAAVHAAEVFGDEVLEEEVVEFAVGVGQADEAGQGTGNGDDAEDERAGAAALGTEEDGQAESFVEDAGKGVCGVDGDRRQERVDFALEIALGEGLGLFVKLVPLEEADSLLAHGGEQGVVPASVLGVDEGVYFVGEGVERFVGAQAVVAGLAIAVFNALHEAGLADFNVLVEVGAGDGEELDAFEKGVGWVLSLFEDAAIEVHPGCIAPVKKAWFLCSPCHFVSVPYALWQSTRFYSMQVKTT